MSNQPLQLLPSDKRKETMVSIELKRKEKKIIQLKYIKAKRLSAQMILISKELKDVNDLDRYFNKY